MRGSFWAVSWFHWLSSISFVKRQYDGSSSGQCLILTSFLYIVSDASSSSTVQYAAFGRANAQMMTHAQIEAAIAMPTITSGSTIESSPPPPPPPPPPVPRSLSASATGGKAGPGRRGGRGGAPGGCGGEGGCPGDGGELGELGGLGGCAGMLSVSAARQFV